MAVNDATLELLLEFEVSGGETNYNLRFKNPVWPGFDELNANCQGALISLVFNRGAAMNGSRRIEMREIRDNLVPIKDCEGIATQIKKMKRLWAGTTIEGGMNRRRDAEAALARTPVNG